jgi:hypothetical protein
MVAFTTPARTDIEVEPPGFCYVVSVYTFRYSTVYSPPVLQYLTGPSQPYPEKAMPYTTWKIMWKNMFVILIGLVSQHSHAESGKLNLSLSSNAFHRVSVLGYCPARVTLGGVCHVSQTPTQPTNFEALDQRATLGLLFEQPKRRYFVGLSVETYINGLGPTTRTFELRGKRLVLGFESRF